MGEAFLLAASPKLGAAVEDVEMVKAFSSSLKGDAATAIRVTAAARAVTQLYGGLADAAARDLNGFPSTLSDVARRIRSSFGDDKKSIEAAAGLLTTAARDMLTAGKPEEGFRL